MTSSATIAELDIVYPLEDVEAQLIGERGSRLVAAGTPGTVVLIHYTGPTVAAYEVEFPLGGGNGMLATVPASEIARAPEGYRRVCPCCGYRTLGDICPGSYEICTVCFWEDDPTQYENPELSAGANHVSLVQAKRNFAQFGACEEEVVSHVRPPPIKSRRRDDA